MTKYLLTTWMDGLPAPQGFSAPDDSSAIWFSKGFIYGLIGRNEEAYVGMTLQLDEDRGTGVFDKSTFVAGGVIERQEGIVGQQWKSAFRRPRHTDMDVGDPHDG